jgi:hypothetical protein
MMSVEDKQLGRELLREMSRRRSIDISDTRMTVTRGVAWVGGIIRPSLGEEFDPKVETEQIKDLIKRIPNMKDVVWEAHFEISTKK